MNRRHGLGRGGKTAVGCSANDCQPEGKSFHGTRPFRIKRFIRRLDYQPARPCWQSRSCELDHRFSEPAPPSRPWCGRDPAPHLSQPNPHRCEVAPMPLTGPAAHPVRGAGATPRRTSLNQSPIGARSPRCH
jgi:hypothetical protein